MANRQTEWARAKKQELRNKLGNICAWMNCTATEKLQFDCIQAMGHGHHRCGQRKRASFYWRQYKADNLQLLCPKHHAIKSKTEHPSYKAPIDELSSQHDSEHDNVPF